MIVLECSQINSRNKKCEAKIFYLCRADNKTKLDKNLKNTLRVIKIIHNKN
jgi:hypothetical protein